jgi:hypothetical protein
MDTKEEKHLICLENAVKEAYEEGRLSAYSPRKFVDDKPQSDGNYLAFIDNGTTQSWVIRLYKDNGWYLGAWDGEVTYWLPLPPEPNEEK